MTAVMGVWATRTLVMVWGTPSSKMRKLLALRPGTNWWVLSRMTLASMLTMGPSMRREEVSPLGFLILGSAGAAGGGGGSSASFFFLRTMEPLSVAGPWSSSGGAVVGLVCWGGGGVVGGWAPGSGRRRVQAARRRRRAGCWGRVVII